MTARILIVEDEPALCTALAERLQSEEYEVACAFDGEDGFRKALSENYDLMILDLMLPRKKGFDVCRDIRKAGLALPIIMLTARTDTADKVVGLKIGADDYVTKPFEMIELLARVEAHLRKPRRKWLDEDAVREFGDLRVDLRGTSVSKSGKAVPLSAREFQLLEYFLQHPGETLSREALLTNVWGYGSDTFTRTVDVHVASLRQKLENDPKNPAWFVTVLGRGYKFTP